MKKICLIFLLIFISYICIAANYIQAEEKKVPFEIENTIRQSLNGYFTKDAGEVMKYVSLNYSAMRNNKPVDYEQLKTGVLLYINSFLHDYVDLSITDLKILKADIQNNMADLEIAYVEKGFNLKTLEEEIWKKERKISLVKEGVAWKITKWEPLEQH